MSRRRSISTDISVDKRFNRIVSSCGPFAGMLYLLMIPHADDDCSMTGDVEELMMMVVPGVRSIVESDVEDAIRAMVSEGLVLRYTDGRLAFPSETFYRYQSYVSSGKRITAEEQAGLLLDNTGHRETPQITAERKESQIITENQRESPENPASPSPSPSPSPLGIVSTNVDTLVHEVVGKGAKKQKSNADYSWFDELWALYPKKQGRSSLKPAALERVRKDGIEEVKAAVLRYREKAECMDPQYVMMGSTFFNGRYKDYMDGAYEEPSQAGLGRQLPGGGFMI